MSEQELVKTLLGNMQTIIVQNREIAIQIATMQGQATEKDKNCERQNDRLEAVFVRTDKLDERITQVEKFQAEITGEQSNQNKSESKLVQWAGIIIAFLVGVAGWLKH